MLFDKKENLKITRKPVYVAVLTTVSMQEFISLLKKINEKQTALLLKFDIETFVIIEGNMTQKTL